MSRPGGTTTGVSQVKYRSADGIELTGQLFENDGAKNTILFFHGNGTTARRRAFRIIEVGEALNANVLAAEFRGYDGLDGSPGEAGVLSDSFAARDFLVDHYQMPASDLIVYGESLGGGCAVAIAADSDAKLLMLDRTFDRMVDVAAGKYWFVPVHYLMRNRYDSLARIAKYDGPVVQWHGNADRLIPIDHARRLHEAAPGTPKFFVEVDGMGHNDPCSADKWAKVMKHARDCLAIDDDNRKD